MVHVKIWKKAVFFMSHLCFHNMKIFNQISIILFIANTNINGNLNFLYGIRVLLEKTRVGRTNFIVLKVGSYKEI